jgi:hypothetical protein
MAGLETAVQVDGTINDNTDPDRGWTVELRIARVSGDAGLARAAAAGGRRVAHGFLAVQPVQEAPPAIDPGGWAWSPHGVWDSHIPELFTRVRLSTEPAGRE